MTEIESNIIDFAKTIGKEKRILDVGCGLRPYEKYFYDSSYIGLDVKKSGRNAIDKLPDVYFDGLNIPFKSNNFDAVVCTQVLEHCIDPMKLASEMYRVLKRKGKVFITVPFMWGKHEEPFDFRRFSGNGIRKLIEDAGFKIKTYRELTSGVSAIGMLVSSEINYFVQHSSNRHKRYFLIIPRLFTHLVWIILLRIWKKIYRFERIYIDNLIIAIKA